MSTILWDDLERYDDEVVEQLPHPGPSPEDFAARLDPTTLGVLRLIRWIDSFAVRLAAAPGCTARTGRAFLKWLASDEDLLARAGGGGAARREKILAAHRQAKRRYVKRISAIEDQETREDMLVELALILDIRRLIAREHDFYFRARRTLGGDVMLSLVHVSVVGRRRETLEICTTLVKLGLLLVAFAAAGYLHGSLGGGRDEKASLADPGPVLPTLAPVDGPVCEAQREPEPTPAPDSTPPEALVAEERALAEAYAVKLDRIARKQAAVVDKGRVAVKHARAQRRRARSAEQRWLDATMRWLDADQALNATLDKARVRVRPQPVVLASLTPTGETDPVVGLALEQLDRRTTTVDGWRAVSPSLEGELRAAIKDWTDARDAWVAADERLQHTGSTTDAARRHARAMRALKRAAARFERTRAEQDALQGAASTLGAF